MLFWECSHRVLLFQQPYSLMRPEIFKYNKKFVIFVRDKSVCQTASVLLYKVTNSNFQSLQLFIWTTPQERDDNNR